MFHIKHYPSTKHLKSSGKSPKQHFFTDLNEEDLSYDEGKKIEMLSKVRVKFDKTKHDLATIISTHDAPN
jgi:hypothetical protein